MNNNYYFAIIRSLNDPLKSGRALVFIPGIDSNENDPNTHWFFTISNNSSTSCCYNVGDRVVCTFLNPEHNQGLIFGKVPVFGFEDGISSHVNLLEQSLQKTSSFALVVPNDLDSYPDLKTTIYNKTVSLFNDTKQIGMMHAQGAILLFDKFANFVLKTQKSIEIESKTKIDISLFGRIEINLHPEKFKITAFGNYILINPANIEINSKSSNIKLTPAGIYINGIAIYLN